MHKPVISSLHDSETFLEIPSIPQPKSQFAPTSRAPRNSNRPNLSNVGARHVYPEPRRGPCRSWVQTLFLTDPNSTASIFSVMSGRDPNELEGAPPLVSKGELRRSKATNFPLPLFSASLSAHSAPLRYLLLLSSPRPPRSSFRLCGKLFSPLTQNPTSSPPTPQIAAHP